MRLRHALACALIAILSSSVASAKNRCAGFSIDGDHFITFTNTCSVTIMVTLRDDGSCSRTACAFGPLRPGGQTRWGRITGRISVDDEQWPDSSGSATPRRTFTVSPSVSQGILNMRSGPGQGHPIVTSIPAGASGVETTGGCVDPDDGKSRYEWCAVQWQGKSGWVSKGGLFESTAQPRQAPPPEPQEDAVTSEEERVGPCLCNNQTNAMRCASDRLMREQCENRQINGQLVEVCSRYKLSVVANAHRCSPY